MLRTLVLTVDPAASPVSGAELRNWQNALALSELGPVKLVSLRPAEPKLLLEGRIEYCPLVKAGDGSSPTVTRRQSSIDVRMTRGALGRLTSLVDAFRPDTILVEGIPLFPFVEHLRASARLLVLDMHNIESDVRAQFERRNLAARLYAAVLGSDATRIRALERKAVDMVDRVWVCSERDGLRLRDLFGAETAIAVVPNSIPHQEAIPAALPPLAGKAGGWPVILFVGHLGYPPNVTAAKFLAKQVFPLIRADFPTARLLIAGRSPADEVLTLASLPAVDLFADPEDLSALYAAAHISVVPLFSGGGTRIKILEAIARGLPVVATPLAAEGLDLAEGTEVLIADTATGLAGHVRGLCSEPKRFEFVRRKSRQTVMVRFGASAVADAVRRAVARDTPLQIGS